MRMRPAPTNLVEHKICYKCEYEGETAEILCPRCRKKLTTSGQTKLLGFVLLVFGAGLVILMGVIIVLAAGTMNKPAGASGARFAGTDSDAFLVFLALGFVMVFGLTSVAAGLWQLLYVRRNKILIRVLIALGVIFLIGAPMLGALN